jgi:hypothetical protein
MGDSEAAHIAYAVEQYVLLPLDDGEVLFQEPDLHNVTMDTREIDAEWAVDSRYIESHDAVFTRDIA